MIFNFDEGVLELPGAWADSTVNVLSRPMLDGTQLAVVLTRVPLKKELDLEGFVDRNIETQKQSMRGWEMLGRRPAVLGNLPGVELKIKWLHDGKMVFHHAAYAVYYDKVLVITGSCAVKFAEECESLMNRILPTLKFRER